MHGQQKQQRNTLSNISYKGIHRATLATNEYMEQHKLRWNTWNNITYVELHLAT